jgi:uncharacterized protein (DUF433 family)
MPFVTGGDGVIRVSGTRVALETVIAAFRGGATPEEIAQQYPSIPLGDLYEVIGYYLRHEADLNGYLKGPLWFRKWQIHGVGWSLGPLLLLGAKLPENPERY